MPDRTPEAPARPGLPYADRLLLRFAEVVEWVGIPRRTLERERSAGRFPPPDQMVGKVPLWKPATLRAWAEKGGGS